MGVLKKLRIGVVVVLAGLLYVVRKAGRKARSKNPGPVAATSPDLHVPSTRPATAVSPQPHHAIAVWDPFWDYPDPSPPRTPALPSTSRRTKRRNRRRRTKKNRSVPTAVHYEEPDLPAIFHQAIELVTQQLQGGRQLPSPPAIPFSQNGVDVECTPPQTSMAPCRDPHIAWSAYGHYNEVIVAPAPIEKPRKVPTDCCTDNNEQFAPAFHRILNAPIRGDQRSPLPLPFSQNGFCVDCDGDGMNYIGDGQCSYDAIQRPCKETLDQKAPQRRQGAQGDAFYAPRSLSFGKNGKSYDDSSRPNTTPVPLGPDYGAQPRQFVTESPEPLKSSLSFGQNGIDCGTPVPFRESSVVYTTGTSFNQCLAEYQCTTWNDWNAEIQVQDVVESFRGTFPVPACPNVSSRISPELDQSSALVCSLSYHIRYSTSEHYFESPRTICRQLQEAARSTNVDGAASSLTFSQNGVVCDSPVSRENGGMQSDSENVDRAEEYRSGSALDFQCDMPSIECPKSSLSFSENGVDVDLPSVESKRFHGYVAREDLERGATQHRSVGPIGRPYPKRRRCGSCDRAATPDCDTNGQKGLDAPPGGRDNAYFAACGEAPFDFTCLGILGQVFAQESVSPACIPFSENGVEVSVTSPDDTFMMSGLLADGVGNYPGQFYSGFSEHVHGTQAPVGLPCNPSHPAIGLGGNTSGINEHGVDTVEIPWVYGQHQQAITIVHVPEYPLQYLLQYPLQYHVTGPSAIVYPVQTAIYTYPFDATG